MSNLCLSYEFSDTRECGWFFFVETIREISIGPSIVRALQNFKDPAILRLGIHLVLQVPHSTIQIEKKRELRCKFDICRLIGGPEVSNNFLEDFISTFPQTIMADFTKAMVGDAMSLLPGVDVESTLDLMFCFGLWYTKPCGRAMTDFGARKKRAMCLGSQMDLIFFGGCFSNCSLYSLSPTQVAIAAHVPNLSVLPGGFHPRYDVNVGRKCWIQALFKSKSLFFL